MACYSNGGATKLTLKKQTGFKVVGLVTDGSTKILPFISASPDVTRPPIDDPSLTGDREESNVRLGAESTTFDLEVAHRFAQYDDLLEAALFGAWTLDVLEVDKIANPVCLWVEQQDVSVDRKYEDLIVNSMTLDAQLDSVITLNFGMSGTSQKLESPSDTTPVAITTSVPYIHFTGELRVAGTAIAYAQSVGVDVQNNTSVINGWGEETAICIAEGKSVVTLNISAQFADAQFLNYLQSETEFAVSFDLSDGVDTETWDFTRCRLIQNSVPVADGQIIQQLQIKALRNTGTGTSAIKITRS